LHLSICIYPTLIMLYISHSFKQATTIISSQLLGPSMTMR
jgi:hypothetical protein